MLVDSRNGNSSGRQFIRRWKRRGAATVEFAVIVPFLAAIMIGSFEMSRGLWAKEILSDAARRACRSGSQPGASNATITADVNSILTANSINSSQVTITIQVNGQTVNASTAGKGDKIAVKVSIPASATMIVTPMFLKSTAIESATVVMMRYDR